MSRLFLFSLIFAFPKSRCLCFCFSRKTSLGLGARVERSPRHMIDLAGRTDISFYLPSTLAINRH